MLRLLKKKAQSATEYAILIGIIIGAVVAMQTWISQRLKAKVYDAYQYQPENWDSSVFGNDTRFEPTDTGTYFTTTRNSNIQEQRFGPGSGQVGAITRYILGEEVTERTGQITYNSAP